MELNEISKLNNWQTDYRQFGAGSFETWFDLYASSKLRFTDQYMNREISVSGIPPHGHVALVLPLNRGGKCVFQGRELGVNDIGLMPADAEVHLRSPKNFRMMVVTIPIARLERALCATAHAKEPQHLFADSPVCRLNRNTFPKLTGAIRHAFDLVQSVPQQAGLDVCLQEIEEEVITILGLALTSPLEPKRGARARRNRLRYLNRAQAYIRAYPDSPLGMETLSSATGASTRSLEMAFREILNTTPVQYIRTNRLNTAKKNLLHADNAVTSVTDTALALGFSHMGRFARDYQALFDEYPSETLSRCG